MIYYAIYKGDEYQYDGTLQEVSLKTGLFEDYIEKVLTDRVRIELSIKLGKYDDTLIAVKFAIDE